MGLEIDLHNVDLQCNPGGIVNAPDPLHKHPGNVIRVIASEKYSVMTAHASGPRSEMLTKPGLEPNKPYVITFNFLNMTHANFTTFFQIVDSPKSGYTQPRIKLLMDSDGKYKLTCGTSATQADSVANKVVVLGSVDPDVGVWTSWRLEVMRSATKKGYVHVYKNSTLVGSVNGVDTMWAPNLQQSPLAHLKFGQYKHSVAVPSTVYYDSIVIA